MSPSVPSLDEVNWRRIGHALGMLVLAVLVLGVVASSVPALVGADDSFVVRSDSMSPAIGAGSVVFVDEVSADQIAAGDVITFEAGAASDSTRITHRVVEVIDDGERRFRTKGDANEDPDPNVVSPDQVVGEVSFSLPLVGHVIAVAGTRLGLIAFVVVPAVALVLLELWDLAKSGGGGETA